MKKGILNCQKWEEVKIKVCKWYGYKKNREKEKIVKKRDREGNGDKEEKQHKWIKWKKKKRKEGKEKKKKH